MPDGTSCRSITATQYGLCSYVAFLLPAGEYLCDWSFPNVLVYVISSHFGVNERKSVRFEPSSSRAYFLCTLIGCRVLSRDSFVVGIRENFIRELSLMESSAKILSRENFSPYGSLSVALASCEYMHVSVLYQLQRHVLQNWILAIMWQWTMEYDSKSM